MSSGPRPTSIASGILIHPTVWPQNINVTDRQDRTDNGRIGHRANRFTNDRPRSVAAKAQQRQTAVVTTVTEENALAYGDWLLHVNATDWPGLAFVRHVNRRKADTYRL